MNIQKIYNQKASCYEAPINYYIVKYVRPDLKILDMGCADGRLGEYLKKNRNATVIGIDISDKAINKAKKVLNDAYCLNIEKDNLPFLEKSFDIIICADVLEHLFDPLETLRKLRSYLKENGYFILSIPNIAEIDIRWHILLGKFDYQEIGILDNTHIRFFTRKTAKNLIRDANLKLMKIDYIPGLSFFFLRERYIKNFPFLRKIKYYLCRIWPTLLCGRFILIAKKE